MEPVHSEYYPTIRTHSDTLAFCRLPPSFLFRTEDRGIYPDGIDHDSLASSGVDQLVLFALGESETRDDLEIILTVAFGMKANYVISQPCLHKTYRVGQEFNQFQGRKRNVEEET